MQINPKKLKFIILIVIGAAFVMFFGWYTLVYSQNPGSNYNVCTGAVTQAACYDSGSVTPRLNWTYTSSAFPQGAFWVQVDNNSDFSSPEVNTPWISSANNYYDIPNGLLTNNITYYWRIGVRDTNNSASPPTNADGPFSTPEKCSSAYSNEASALLLCSPSGLTATPTPGSCSQINLSWQDNSNDENGFEIDRSGFTFNIAPSSGTGIVNFSDVGLTENTTYTYRVRAFNIDGYSDYSNTANTATTDCPDVNVQLQLDVGPPEVLIEDSATVNYSEEKNLKWQIISGCPDPPGCTCSASCDSDCLWDDSNPKSTSGTEPSGNITHRTEFILTCASPYGSGSDSVVVDIRLRPWWKEIFPW